jgi:flagellar protein FlaG
MEVSSISQSVPVAPTAVVSETDQAAQNREIVQAVKAVNSAELYGPNQELTYQQDTASKRMVVRVVDSTTKQVLVQIPPEYVLALAADLGKT